MRWASPPARRRSIRRRRSRASPKRWRSGAIADAAILTEAAFWVERLAAAPHAATRRAFEAWRAASPAHAAAYHEAAVARDAAAALAAEQPLLALRHEAVARAALARRPKKRLAVAAGVLLLAGGPLAAWSIQHWTPRAAEPLFTRSARTGIGEQAEVALPDGSRIMLDTASRLSVRYEGGRRSIAIEGQGWFDLKPGAAPATISAGGRTLTAEAGRFDVRTDPGALRALAVTGRLGIEGADISAGQLLVAKGDSATIERPASLPALTAWRDGLIQFQDMPLADAAAELNRYRRQPIRVADDQAAGLKISGSFRTQEGPAFVDALVSGFPVRVKRDSADAIVIGSR